MFQSVKETLTIIKNNQSNSTYANIASYLLVCLENNSIITSQQVAKACFVSEPTLTNFAKHFGYHGFRELVLRIKIENEYYQNKQFSQRIIKDNFRQLFEENLNLIDDQNQKIYQLIEIIKTKQKVYFFSSYEQTEQVELFSGELEALGIDVYFNTNRKANRAWINKIESEDFVIFFAFGLDNQYLVNYYNLIKEKNKNIILISSYSQKVKFDNYLISIIVDYVNRIDISLTTRIAGLQYLFSKIIYQLTHN